MAKDDFDFFHGTWHVHNRRLTGEGSWGEFEGSCVTRPLADGIGFIDEMHFPTLGVWGHTIGLYDSGRELWAHYWVGSRDGVLQPPLYGKLTGPTTAEFFGDDTLDGAAIRVRQMWTLESPDVIVWEQAYASAGGGDWQTNWVMTSTRAG
ncbi:hypothetical protein [Allorhizocola rhizosphaerae]|uniref:hypothetical protein n=1 Tax=Allorhizocola rhizosphaerae TaxID=1872709 RepID=UPI000E3D88EC|nr:hypothetical protein [Allorhizocola rhizosphaerae]